MSLENHLHCTAVRYLCSEAPYKCIGKRREKIQPTQRFFPTIGDACCPRTWIGTATGDAGDGRRGRRDASRRTGDLHSMDWEAWRAIIDQILDRKNRIKASSTPTLHVGWEASRLVSYKFSNTTPESYQLESIVTKISRLCEERGKSRTSPHNWNQVFISVHEKSSHFLCTSLNSGMGACKYAHISDHGPRKIKTSPKNPVCTMGVRPPLCLTNARRKGVLPNCCVCLLHPTPCSIKSQPTNQKLVTG